MKPFWNSLPISINELSSRKEVVREIIQYINYGTGVCLSGDLRIAKTSLLNYLISSQEIHNLFASSGQKIVFNYINCQTIPSEFNSNEFWQLSFQPFFSYLNIEWNSKDSIVMAANKLERIWASHRQLLYVIVLDEIDVLLSHPVIGKEYFILGQYRHLATIIRNFSIIISSPYNLSELSEMARHNVRQGSPVFNVFHQITLQPLPEEDILTALKYADPPFSPKERKFIMDISGGHPFLIDITASALWEQKSEGRNKYFLAIESIRRNAVPFFADKWHRWSEQQREAIVAIALLQAPIPSKNQAFDTNKLVADLEFLQPEINSFRYSGEITEDSSIPGGYRIRQAAMLWWIADQIFRTLREGNNFDEWLLGQKKSNINSRIHLGKVVEISSRIFEKGATTLLEAYIKQLMNP